MTATIAGAAGFEMPGVEPIARFPAEVVQALDEWVKAVAAARRTSADEHAVGTLFEMPPAPEAIDRYAAELCGRETFPAPATPGS